MFLLLHLSHARAVMVLSLSGFFGHLLNHLEQLVADGHTWEAFLRAVS